MRPLLYIAVLPFFFGCNDIEKSNHFDKQRITEEVKRMLVDYHTDIAKEGLTAEFKYLDRSPDFFWVPPGYETALTYDSVRTILENSAKTLRSAIFSWDTLKIYPLTDVIANYSGIVKGQMIDTSGAKSTVSIIESGTLIRRKDGWKLLNGQSAVLEGKPKNKDLPEK